MTLAPRRVAQVNVSRRFTLAYTPKIIVCGVPCFHASSVWYDGCNVWDWESATFVYPVMGSRLVMEQE
jgi:hypothetical protein